MKYSASVNAHFILPLLFFENNDVLFHNGTEQEYEIDEYVDAYESELDWDENTLLFMVNNGIIPIHYLWRH